MAGRGGTCAVRYQAARAFEINAALDAAVETAREAIAGIDPELARKPSDESLAQFTWKAMQSVKYDEGAAKTSTLTTRLGAAEGGSGLLQDSQSIQHATTTTTNVPGSGGKPEPGTRIGS